MADKFFTGVFTSETKNTSYFHLLKEEEDANERRAIRKMDELKQ